MENINGNDGLRPPAPHSGKAGVCFIMSFLFALPASVMIFPLALEMDGLRWPYLWAMMMPLSLFTMLWLSPRVRFWGHQRRSRYLKAIMGIFVFAVFAHVQGLDGDLFGKMWSIFCFIPFYASLAFTLGSAYLPRAIGDD